MKHKGFLIIFVLVFAFNISLIKAEDNTSKTEWKQLYSKTAQAYKKGNYKKGILFADKAYKYALQHFGKFDPDTLTSMNNLATLYKSQGRYGKAELLYKEALQLGTKVLGKEHPNTLTFMNNLALLYHSQGRYGEAEPLFKEALQLRTKVLGKEYPYTLSSMNNLAGLYESQGRYGEAEPLYKEALQLYTKVLGKEHPDTLTSMNNLAGLYKLQGRYGEAEPLFKEALQLYTEVLGKKHPDTLTSMYSLAFWYQSQGRYGEAEPLYKEALQLHTKVLGKDHPDTVDTQLDYTVLLVNMGKDRFAFRLLKQLEGRFFSHSFQELYTTSAGSVRRLYLNNIAKFQSVVFSFVRKYPKEIYTNYAANIILRWKQIDAEESAFQHRFASINNDPEIKKINKDIVSLKQDISRIKSNPESNDNLNSLIKQLEIKQQSLRFKSKQYKPNIVASTANIDQVLTNLPDKSAIIEFRQYQSADFKKGTLGKHRLCAYLDSIGIFIFY